MLLTVVLFNIFMEAVIYLFQDYLLNRKKKNWIFYELELLKYLKYKKKSNYYIYLQHKATSPIHLWKLSCKYSSLRTFYGYVLTIST